MHLPAIDYHIHTVYSGHAEANMTVRNIISQAEKVGLEAIAITEHVFSPEKGKVILEQIREEARIVETEVKVMVGLEIDPDYTQEGRLIFEEFSESEVDIVLVSTHFYPILGRWWDEKFQLSPLQKKDICRAWFRLMERVVENPLVDVLAHPGRLISQNGIIEEFDKCVLEDFNRLFNKARRHGVAIELNENFLKRFPTEKLRQSYIDVFRLAISEGVKLSLGSDSHAIEDIGQYRYASSFISSAGISPTDYFINT